MRFDENCWQTVFRLKLNLASEHRTRTEPPYANLIKTLCTLSCKMCKSKLKQHCQPTKIWNSRPLYLTDCVELFSFEFTGFLGHVLIQWDMQLTSVDYVVWCWPVGAGGRRWQCLGGRRDGKLPGWARQRGPLGHLPDEIRCPGCPPVDAPARWWEVWLC